MTIPIPIPITITMTMTVAITIAYREVSLACLVPCLVEIEIACRLRLACRDVGFIDGCVMAMDR